MARLVRKTLIPYNGKVHDLTVSNSHTYNVEGLAVHNSAGASLLAYFLDITQMDPIKHGLLFERMLTKTKKGFPDIDSDFSDRDQAIKILIEYFGEENIVPVSNFVQLQLRSLIKDVGRFHGIPVDELNASTGKIEVEAMAVDKLQPGFDRGTWVLTYEKAEKNSPTFQALLVKYPEFESTLRILFKQMRNISRHAGGVIITENAREAMPLIKASGELQTPWPEGVNYRHLEELGLLKFDILGLGTLRMFEDCIRKILVKGGNRNPSFKQVKQWYYENLHPDNNEMTDQKVFKQVYWDKNYSGVFQFSAENTQRFMAEMKPKSILDIAVATSIFRPGPLGLGVDRQYLENRRNPAKVTYKHPFLEEVYTETAGLLVFQEQLQMIYHKLAGVPLDETDAVRKAFTKKEISNKAKAEEERLKLRGKFLELCRSANNIEEVVSGSIFDEMEKLVSYSFNKAHAMAYAIISYQCAHLLTYYPDEWVTSYIDYSTVSKGKVSGKEDPKAVAMKEAQRLGYSIGKPDINLSDYEFTFDPSDKTRLVPGFASLLYVGKSVMGELKAFRPYTQLTDLLVNPGDGTWRHSKFNKRALSTLIKLEALDSMGLVGPGKTFQNYSQFHAAVIDQYDLLKRISSRKKKNEIGPEFEKIILGVQGIPEWTDKEKITHSQELAGSVDIDLIISPDMKDKLMELGFDSVDNWAEKGNYWAIVNSATKGTTKKGKPFLRIKMYAESKAEYTCFVWNFNKTHDLEANDVICGHFDKTDFGFSTFANSFYKLLPA